MKKKNRDSVRRVLKGAMQNGFVYRMARLIAGTSEEVLVERVQQRMIALAQGNEHRVMYGPFEGLIYPLKKPGLGEKVRRGTWQRLIGTYESELHHTLEKLRTKGYRTVINIGAAEGYYAAGLARLLPEAHVFAYEAKPERREACAEMVRLNEVGDRVTLGGLCSAEMLTALLEERDEGFIFADCTGCELELLQPDTLPSLRRCDILFELHDFNDEGPTVSQVIYERFAKTHHVEVINIRFGKPVAHLDLDTFSSVERRMAISEPRKYSVGWVYLSSRERTNAGAADTTVAASAAL